MVSPDSKSKGVTLKFMTFLDASNIKFKCTIDQVPHINSRHLITGPSKHSETIFFFCYYSQILLTFTTSHSLFNYTKISIFIRGTD